MQKTTIELTRIPRHWAGYGLMNQPFTNESGTTLDALVDWAAKASCKVYRHLVRAEEERIGDDGTIQRIGCDIPLCDLVYYLDIYHQ